METSPRNKEYDRGDQGNERGMELRQTKCVHELRGDGEREIVRDE